MLGLKLSYSFIEIYSIKSKTSGYLGSEFTDLLNKNEMFKIMEHTYYLINKLLNSTWLTRGSVLVKILLNYYITPSPILT